MGSSYWGPDSVTTSRPAMATYMFIKSSYQQEERNPRVPSSTERQSPWLKWHSKAEKRFLKGQPRTHFIPDMRAEVFTHYGRTFYSSRPRKASVLACWRPSTSLPVLTSNRHSQLLRVWSTAALCQSPLLSQPYSAISHGSMLIIWLTAGSSSSFPAWISCCNTQCLQTSSFCTAFCKQLLFGHRASHNVATAFFVCFLNLTPLLLSPSLPLPWFCSQSTLVWRPECTTKVMEISCRKSWSLSD